MRRFEMTCVKKSHLYRHASLILLSLTLLLFMSCSAKESASAQESEVEVITARFTDPIDLEAQVSDTCIACHTKTNPITKLASPPPAAGAETGG